MHPRSCLSTSNRVGSPGYKAGQRSIGGASTPSVQNFWLVFSNMAGGITAVDAKAGYAHLLDPNRKWYNNWRSVLLASASPEVSAFRVNLYFFPADSSL